MKKVVMRKCVVTNERFEKKELIRIVKTKDNEVLVDPSGKINGHGAYLKIDADVFNKARKTKVLDKYLETTINENIYEELEKLLK